MFPLLDDTFCDQNNAKQIVIVSSHVLSGQWTRQLVDLSSVLNNLLYLFLFRRRCYFCCFFFFSEKEHLNYCFFLSYYFAPFSTWYPVFDNSSLILTTVDVGRCEKCNNSCFLTNVPVQVLNLALFFSRCSMQSSHSSKIPSTLPGEQKQRPSREARGL